MKIIIIKLGDGCNLTVTLIDRQGMPLKLAILKSLVISLVSDRSQNLSFVANSDNTLTIPLTYASNLTKTGMYNIRVKGELFDGQSFDYTEQIIEVKDLPESTETTFVTSLVLRDVHNIAEKELPGVNYKELGYEVFSPFKAYAKDSVVLFGDTLYKFTSAKAAGIWNASKVEATSVAVGAGANYSNLLNKPKINGNTVEGDKTGSELGLVDGANEITNSEINEITSGEPADVEGYYYDGVFYEESTHESEITPSADETYLDLTTGLVYVWNGEEYVLFTTSGGSGMFKSGEAVDDVEIVNDMAAGGEHNVASAEVAKTIGEAVFGVSGYTDVDLSEMQSNKYYHTQKAPKPYHISTTAGNLEGCHCIMLQVQEGDKFKIHGTGYRAATLLWAFGDADNLQLSCAEAQNPAAVIEQEFIAPKGAVTLIVNFRNYNASTDYLKKYNGTASLDDRIKALENKEVVKSVLQDKVFVCFGDSLTEFKDYGTDNGTWCNYAQGISGASFINIGIGGTQLKSRVSIKGIFDETKTYALNDYLYKETDGHYHFYKCTTAHTGVWDANDFTEISNSNMYAGLDMVNLITEACNTAVADIDARLAVAAAAADCVKTNTETHDDSTPQIARLKNVDWDEVDAVIVMGGANDYSGYSAGQSSSTDITTTTGAVNTIIQQLSTAYPDKPIYFIKEPVKWFKHEVDGQAVFTDDYWCDVYDAGHGTTNREFYEEIEELCVANHTLVCDLYNGLGWNKFNFWNYFRRESDDGSHPKFGFRFIAEKIVSFIIANKVF